MLQHMLQQTLRDRAANIRINILEMARRSKSAHVGSSLSIADILAYLYFSKLRLGEDRNPPEPRDRFILSKGHGAMALYATLGEKGLLPKETLAGYMQDNGTLPAHLDTFSSPHIDVSAGSLGHGLPMGLGLAHGMKKKGNPGHVYVLMGDGETQEGSIWESAMMAPKLGVDNLTAIIDLNNLQGYGRPTEIMHFDNLDEKWSAFGWLAIHADGHDFESMEEAFSMTGKAEGPSVIIMNTTKGKGVSFMEDELKWHYFIVTDELFEQARNEILAGE